MDVKVSRLTSYIANIFKTDPIMMNIGVIGEISNLKYHGSGAVFFTLKDDKASIRCQMWERNVSRLRFRLQDGMQVKAVGKVTVYEKGGTYSLTAEDIEAVGEGALMAAYRALYAKLSMEGLFSEEHKKPLPVFPRKVCIITSDTGAALRDMLKIIRSRNMITDVFIYPVLVQGPDAAGEISSAIRDVNHRFRDTDVIITGRGGGSLEDLWAFNEEMVAREIYDSGIPVVSAVCHETDYTIADFVADVRAETPTAAAVLAVPDVQMLRRQVRELFDHRIRDRLQLLYHDREQAVERCSPFYLIQSLRNQYALKSESLKRYEPVQLGRTVSSRVEKSLSDLELQMDLLRRLVHDTVKERADGLEKARIMMEAADPDRIVQRGYAIVTDKNGEPVTSIAVLDQGSEIQIRLKDGIAEGEVRKVIMENRDAR